MDGDCLCSSFQAVLQRARKALGSPCQSAASRPRGVRSSHPWRCIRRGASRPLAVSCDRVRGLLAQTVPERVPSTAHLLHLQGRWLSSADACAFFVPSSSGKFHSKGKCSKAVRGMAWSLFNGSFGRSIQMSAGRGCHRRLFYDRTGFCRVIFSPGPRSSVHESTPISAITGFSALPESPCLVM